MRIQTLSSVTIETIENYRHAANAAVKAYRIGSQRLIDAVNAGIEKSVYARTEEYAPNLTLTMNQFRGNVTEIIVKGVDGVTANTEKAITVSTTSSPTFCAIRSSPCAIRVATYEPWGRSAKRASMVV